MAMEYVIQQSTVDRLSNLHDGTHALSQGRYSEIVDARIAAAPLANHVVDHPASSFVVATL